MSVFILHVYQVPLNTSRTIINDLGGSSLLREKKFYVRGSLHKKNNEKNHVRPQIINERPLINWLHVQPILAFLSLTFQWYSFWNLLKSLGHDNTVCSPGLLENYQYIKFWVKGRGSITCLLIILCAVSLGIKPRYFMVHLMGPCKGWGAQNSPIWYTPKIFNNFPCSLRDDIKSSGKFTIFTTLKIICQTSSPLNFQWHFFHERRVRSIPSTLKSFWVIFT